MWLELRFSVRRQYQLLEQLGIQESRIGLTGPHTVAGMLGIGGNGDLFPHLETHLKVFGDLRQIVSKLVCGGRSVEGRVIAHRSEERLALVLILAVLAQAFTGERALGVLLLVDLALPAFIGPSGGTEPDQGGERK